MRSIVKDTVYNYIRTGVKDPSFQYIHIKGNIVIRNELNPQYHWQVFIPLPYTDNFCCEYQIFSVANADIIERGVIYIAYGKNDNI